ncbi:MAG: rod shape-determining protein MreC [Treponema sp.]|nr:rod shape-determining protein MreC [Treponema sp.]MBR1614815.1 rod shape-determining protein MreC [Treponema sp.]MBR1714498.1 rod shape-determining protein MreC [Treponema sp.]
MNSSNQSRHFFRFHIAEFVFVILLGLSTVLLASSSGGFVLNFERIGFSIVSSLQKGVNAVSTGIGDTINAVQELSRMKKENAVLVEKLKNYEYFQRNNTEINKENERLREQLGFSTKIEQKNYPAQIIGRNTDNLYSTFTINKGSRVGIKKNMPVIAIQNGQIGLVGKIVSVGAETSMILPIFDSKCTVSARIQTTRDIGLVSGLGADDRTLSMRYIKKRVLEELNYGDTIVTSGENGNYLRDITIGTISKITVLDYDSSLDIEVVPIIDFSRLESVIVADLKELNPSLVNISN